MTEAGTMRAVVKKAALPGRDGTEIRSVPIPLPEPGEVLVKVLATAVCGTDRHIYNWDPSIQGSVAPPRIYGHEFCGELAAFGPGTESLDISIGSYLSCEMHVICGRCRECRSGNGHICRNTSILGLHGDGCFAEYVAVPAANVIPIDSAIPPRIAAFLDALGNAVHTTQVVDLSGQMVAILGFGPIGAMCASIALHSGAAGVLVSEVSPYALKRAEKLREKAPERVEVVDASDPMESRRVAAAFAPEGCDVILETSGAESSLGFGLEIVRNGGHLSLLGIPSSRDLTIHDYARNVIFKGVTMKAIIGRRMFDTWQKMLMLLRSGLDVSHVVTGEFDGLEAFHEAMDLLNRREAQKIVFYPHGRDG